MTRTARAAYPRAMIKDRSENRTGLEGNRRSMPKDGAGGHNWGSLADERQNELAALEDASFDEEEAGAARADMPDARQARLGSGTCGHYSLWDQRLLTVHICGLLYQSRQRRHHPLLLLCHAARALVQP